MQINYKPQILINIILNDKIKKKQKPEKKNKNLKKENRVQIHKLQYIAEHFYFKQILI